MEPRRLAHARQIHAIAQTGLHYNASGFERERYEKLRDIAAEMLAGGSEADLPPIRELLAGQDGHVTPKVDVRGAVFRDGRLLLVREYLDEGRWSLPGGYADVNESPAQAVTREALEESGWRVRATRLLALYDRRRHAHPPGLFHLYKVFFQCETLDAEPVTQRGRGASFEETGEARFFAEDELPPDLSTRRVTRAQLLRFFEMMRDPSLPADFD